jgi:hypothetical protein
MQPFRSEARFFPDYATPSVMPARTAGIQARRDASGDIRVSLGSGTPCRNDDTEANTRHRNPPRDLARYDKRVGSCFRMAMSMGLCRAASSSYEISWLSIWAQA